MALFNVKTFGRFARKNSVGGGELHDAAEDIQAGNFDADLGGGLFKQRVEPPRDFGRLQLLRRWGDEQDEIFTGSARARGSAGAGASGRVRLAVGGDRIDCREDWLFVADAVQLGASGRA
ncbi:type II toxin-antitoxin system RelE/ParE family toxin [Xanthomonas fragariae]|uniref:type II toxin-antitoxin system RelE/ParE family toxin n=1 Tax=Xanthomonas fragariae TaxID=48664 RepID=UPI003D2F68BC